jgi:hypothetical protein
MWTAQGDPIHCELLTADAHLTPSVPVYKSGDITQYTPTSTEVMSITDVIVGTLLAGTITVTVGNVLVAKLWTGARTTFAHHFETPVVGVSGGVLTITSDVVGGQAIAIVAQGYIQEA